MRSQLLDELDRSARLIDAVQFRGSYRADYQTQKVRLSPEVTGLVPIQRSALVDPIAFSDLDCFIHPDDREWYEQIRSQAPPPSGRMIFEYRQIDKDGQLRWIQNHACVVVDRYGEPLQGTGIVLDVTSFKLDGDSIQTTPHAPFSHPINHLADGLITARKAARELGHADIERSITKMLRTVARMLAGRISKSRH